MSELKQKVILSHALKLDGKISKRDAVALLQHNYYCNAGKYVGEILSRMVKNQTLKRIRPGLFEINNKVATETSLNSNQSSLF